MYANRRNFRVFREIGVEEHDGDVRFKSASGNMAVSCMRNASGHNYRNSSVIVTWLWSRFFKLFGILKFVKIREFKKMLTFVKFGFSDSQFVVVGCVQLTHNCGLGLQLFVRSGFLRLRPSYKGWLTVICSTGKWQIPVRHFSSAKYQSAKFQSVIY